MTAKEIYACNANPKEYLKNNDYEALFKNNTKSVFHHAVSYISGLYQREVFFICDIPSDTLVYITLPEPVIPQRQGNIGRFPTKLKILNTSPIQVRWLAEIQKSWDSVDIRLTDRGIKTVDCTVLTV